MSPAKETYYRSLFVLAAVYDVLVGITFLFFRRRAYEAMVDMIEAFRMFELGQKSIQIQDQSVGESINSVGVLK